MNKQTAYWKQIIEIIDNVPELNMGNYDDDQVRDLNNAMIQLSQVISKMLIPQPQNVFPSDEDINAQVDDLLTNGNLKMDLPFREGVHAGIKWLHYNYQPQPVIDFPAKIKVIIDRIIKYDESFTPKSLHPILIGGIIRILEDELITGASRIDQSQKPVIDWDADVVDICK